MDWSDFSGLRARKRICLGRGLSKEAAKEQIFARGGSLLSHQICSIQELAQQVVPDRVLVSPGVRRAILEMLLRRQEIAVYFPELRKFQKRAGFLKRLDRALQKTRGLYAELEEREVLLARLAEKNAHSVLREEILRMADAYESYLDSYGGVDSPLLLRLARDRLRDGAIPEGWRGVEWVYLYQSDSESLEQSFLDEVAKCVSCEWVKTGMDSTTNDVWTLHRAHTWDEAVSALADTLAKKESGERSLLVIPDRPELRRSLRRGLKAAGIATRETRDPLSVRQAEVSKRILLPLQLVGQRFERSKVLEWLWSLPQYSGSEKQVLTREIQRRGLRRGLQGYQGGVLAGLGKELATLQGRFSQRLTLEQLQVQHEACFETGDEREFLTRVYESLSVDWEFLKQETLALPVLSWLKKLQELLEEIAPSVQRLVAQEGVEIHLFQQAPLWKEGERVAVHFFGLGERDLYWEPTESDMALSWKEREWLAVDFQIEGLRGLQEDRQRLLLQWFVGAKEVHWHLASYDGQGKELRNIDELIAEKIPVNWNRVIDQPRKERLLSYRNTTRIQCRSVKLPNWENRGKKHLEATELDRYTRCSFQALVDHRWKIQDEREPEDELWPDVRGTILHRAIEWILQDREKGQDVNLAGALERAWSERNPAGWMKGRHSEQYVKGRLMKILVSFWDDEQVYRARSETKLYSVEREQVLELEVDGTLVRGVPDRLDQHVDGVFVIDYKTTTDVPTGAEILEQGYRLQLPFYAVAAREKLGQEVLGAQYVSLGREVSRARGIFLEAYNGKNPGSLTHTRSKASLFSDEPEVIWSRAKALVEESVRSIKQGHYEAKPRLEKECVRCRLTDVCGQRRFLWSRSGLGESEEG